MIKKKVFKILTEAVYKRDDERPLIRRLSSHVLNLTNSGYNSNPHMKDRIGHLVDYINQSDDAYEHAEQVAMLHGVAQVAFPYNYTKGESSIHNVVDSFLKRSIMTYPDIQNHVEHGKTLATKVLEDHMM